jgi:sulfur carrier protein ThiS
MRNSSNFQNPISGFHNMSALVKPIGTLKKYVDGRSQIAIGAGCTVRAALKMIGIPSEIVALVLVNDKPHAKDYYLCDEDVVVLLAVVGGG